MLAQDQLDLENELVWQAWLNASEAIKDTLGDYYTKSSYGLVLALSIRACITDFDTANLESIQANGEELISNIRHLIAREQEAYNRKLSRAH